MKKLSLMVLWGLFAVAAQAQTKVTKANTIGKWNIAVMNMDGMLYFDIEKDSLALGTKLIEQLANTGQDSTGAVEMMKGQLETVKEMSLELFEDGTYSMDGATPGGGTERGTYTVDEATETIFITPKKTGEKQELKCAFNNEKLIIQMPNSGQPGAPNITMHFRKAKQ